MTIFWGRFSGWWTSSQYPAWLIITSCSHCFNWWKQIDKILSTRLINKDSQMVKLLRITLLVKLSTDTVFCIWDVLSQNEIKLAGKSRFWNFVTELGHYISDKLREAGKKVLFLVVGPLKGGGSKRVCH